MSIFRRGVTFSVVFCLWLLVPPGGVSPSSAGTPIYTYKDDSGTATYTPELDSIPEKYRSRAVPLDFESSAPGGARKHREPAVEVRCVTSTGSYPMPAHRSPSRALP